VPQGVTAAPPSAPKQSIPPAQYSAEQITQTPTKTEVSRWGFDTSKSIDVDRSGLNSPYGLACAAVAELAIKLIAMGVELFRALLRWLNKLLGKFGLGVGGNEATRSIRIAPAANYIDAPSRILPNPLQIETAASEINQVAAAIEKNDASLLPESAKSLSEYFEKQDSSE
jgi:hypothetical protein